MQEQFKQWALIELMGYRKIAGLITEATVAGATFIRIDIENSAIKIMTQYYHPSAVYSITPIKEEIAKQFMDKNFTQLIKIYDLLLPKPHDSIVEEDDIPFESWEDNKHG